MKTLREIWNHCNHLDLVVFLTTTSAPMSCDDSWASLAGCDEMPQTPTMHFASTPLCHTQPFYLSPCAPVYPSTCPWQSGGPLWLGRAGWSGAASGPVGRLGWSWPSSGSSPAQTARPACTTDRQTDRQVTLWTVVVVVTQVLSIKFCSLTTRTRSRSTSARRSFSQQ